jgi:hypothetical protein
MSRKRNRTLSEQANRVALMAGKRWALGARTLWHLEWWRTRTAVQMDIECCARRAWLAGRRAGLKEARDGK